MQDAPDGCRTDRSDVGVDHHVCQSSITFGRMLGIGADNSLFFPVFQPEVSRNHAVVFVGLTVT